MQLDSQSQITACCLLISEVIKTGRHGCHRISQLPRSVSTQWMQAQVWLICLWQWRQSRSRTTTSSPTCCLQERHRVSQTAQKVAFWTVLFPWDRDVLKSIKALGTEWSAPLRNCLTFIHALLCNKNGRRLPSSPKKVSDRWVWFQNLEKERRKEKKRRLSHI